MMSNGCFYRWNELYQHEVKSFKSFVEDTNWLGKIVLGFMYLIPMLAIRLFKLAVAVVLLLCTVPFYFLSYLGDFLFFKKEYNPEDSMKKRFKDEVIERFKRSNRFLISSQDVYS